MLLSMTGYGRASTTWENKTFKVELRSLNSKYSDLRLKCPQNLREKEAALRKLVVGFALRGKVEMTVDVESMEGDSQFGLNQSLFRRYFKALSELSEEFNYQDQTLMSAILRVPNMTSGGEKELEKGEWAALVKTVNSALDKFQEFRQQEGAATATDLAERIHNITERLEQIPPHEEARIVVVRERLRRNLEEAVNKERIDENRFEQELIYYLEKMDINEEKMRLAQHCNYFLEVLDNDKHEKGRKLSFISQEIGREINTLGAKAYSAEIQKLVVGMKDELEKIKEQTANIV